MLRKLRDVNFIKENIASRKINSHLIDDERPKVNIRMANSTLQIRQLTPNDLDTFRELISLLNRVFESPDNVPRDGYLHALLNNPSFIAIGVIHDKEVIGGLTAYLLAMATHETSEVFIYDIAIREDFQRTGVGRQLLSELNNYCSVNGIRQIFVDASEIDGHAVKFYQATGGRGEKVVQFTYIVNKT